MAERLGCFVADIENGMTAKELMQWSAELHIRDLDQKYQRQMAEAKRLAKSGR